jgi:hypothetical protein
MTGKRRGSVKLFEEWVEKYERRIKKITENPDPKLARSNLTLYKLMLDQVRDEVEAWRAEYTQPVCYTDVFMIFGWALGFRTHFVEGYADRLTPVQAAHYFKLIRNTGWPDNSCDRVQLNAAVGVSGDIPAPDVVITELDNCDSLVQSSIVQARHWKVPLLTVDCPPFEQGRDAIRYVEEQLWDIIRFCEKNFPGIKYDPAKLTELQKLHKYCFERELEVKKMAMAKPCPLAGRDSLRMTPVQLYYEPRLAGYYDELMAELRAKVSEGRPAVTGEEKFRLFWMCTAPFYHDPFTPLEQRGVSIPLYEEGFGVAPRYCELHDEMAMELFGFIPENPVQQQAAVCVSNIWDGFAEQRISNVFKHARTHSIDGFVQQLQPGCQTLNCMAKVMGERAEKELGIKSIYIEAWCQDMEKHNEEEFEAKLNDWITVCLAEKERKARESI